MCVRVDMHMCSHISVDVWHCTMTGMADQCLLVWADSRVVLGGLLWRPVCLCVCVCVFMFDRGR